MHRYSFVILAALAVVGAAQAGNWFVVNEDNDHFFKLPSEEMSVKGLTDYADYIARGKVTHVFLCVCGQRTSYDSKTWEPIWAGLNETARKDTATWPDGTHDRWAVNCKLLHDKGIDPYAVWIARFREKGVSPWVSMRMNDVHFASDTNFFRNTSFYKAHREWYLKPGSTRWRDCQLDYARPEVRAYALAQAREIAERWDADGIELDWMRAGNAFRYGEERKNAHLLDAFMREVRKAVDAAAVRRGKRLSVAVRVPPTPEEAAGLGFNAVAWAREGLVDVVVPDDYKMTRPDLPVADWLRELRGTKARLVPGTGSYVPETVAARDVPSLFRGLAKTYFAQGATGVYLFNLPYLSNVRYSTDGNGNDVDDVAATLYEEGVLPEGRRDFFVQLRYRPSLDPAAKDGVCPSLEMYRECGLLFNCTRTDLLRRYEPDRRTYAKEATDRRVLMSPVVVTNLLRSYQVDPYAAARFADRPMTLDLDMTRDPFLLERRYDVDRAGHERWRRTHPNFLGVRALCEFDHDAGVYVQGVNKVEDPELRQRLLADFPLPKDQYEWIDFARLAVERCRPFFLGEPGFWCMNSSCYTLAHIMARLGAVGVEYEATGQEQGRWQVAGAFVRGASRQWQIPFGWYVANWYTGFTRDGKPSSGENNWSKDCRKVGGTSAPHLGLSRSLIARQAAYGYLIGAAYVEPENWFASHLLPGRDADGHPAVSDIARDLNDLYLLSKRIDRGGVVTPCAILTPVSERYNMKGWQGSPSGWFADRFQQNAFFFTLAPVLSEDIKHRSLRKVGNEGCLFNSEFGEFYDVLVPDAGPDAGKFAAALTRYRAAFLVGGFRKDDLDAAAIMRWVKDGGTLYLGADRLLDGFFPTSFAGVSFVGGEDVSEAAVTDDRGQTFEPQGAYAYLRAEAVGAQPILKDAAGHVVAYRNVVGKGQVVVVTAKQMLPVACQDAPRIGDYDAALTAIVSGRQQFGLIRYFLRRVQEETMPVKVTGDIQWGVNRIESKVDSPHWLVWLINNKGVVKYSYEPEELDASKTASVTATFDVDLVSAYDVRSEKEIPVSGRSFSVTVCPGQWKAIRVKAR